MRKKGERRERREKGEREEEEREKKGGREGGVRERDEGEVTLQGLRKSRQGTHQISTDSEYNIQQCSTDNGKLEDPGGEEEIHTM